MEPLGSPHFEVPPITAKAVWAAMSTVAATPKARKGSRARLRKTEDPAVRALNGFLCELLDAVTENVPAGLLDEVPAGRPLEVRFSDVYAEAWPRSRYRIPLLEHLLEPAALYEKLQSEGLCPLPDPRGWRRWDCREHVFVPGSRLAPCRGGTELTGAGPGFTGGWREATATAWLRRGSYMLHRKGERPRGGVFGWGLEPLSEFASQWPEPVGVAQMLAWASLGPQTIVAAEEIVKQIWPQAALASWAGPAPTGPARPTEVPWDYTWEDPREPVASPQKALELLQAVGVRDRGSMAGWVAPAYYSWLEPLRDLNQLGVGVGLTQDNFLLLRARVDRTL